MSMRHFRDLGVECDLCAVRRAKINVDVPGIDCWKGKNLCPHCWWGFEHAVRTWWKTYTPMPVKAEGE